MNLYNIYNSSTLTLQNQKGTKPIITLIQALKKNITLQYLNLSKNNLTDEAGEIFKEYLDTAMLKELYLHWNQLKSQFGKNLFQVLAENEYLRVLDISNNSLGAGTYNCASEIAEFFLKNSTLLHLDISYNYIDFESSKILAEGIIKNDTIYGIHYVGNSGFIDSRGFIVPEQINQEIIGALSKRRIKSTQIISKTLLDDRNKQLRDCCWICEGWIEKNFVWTKDISGSYPTDPLFIHFNFEDYVPCYLGKQEDPNQTQFSYNRMVPQSKVNYFYSGDQQFFYAEDHPLKHQTNPINDVQNNMEEYVKIDISHINEIKQTKIQSFIDIKNSYQINVKAKPRTLDPIYVPPKKKKKRIKWKFPISLMAKWRQDDDEIINLCFDYDFECSKVPKIIKDADQLEQIRLFFRSNYKYIKNAYLFYSSLNPVGDIWAIQNAPFVEMIEKIRIIDNKVTMEFINIKWTAVISGIKGQVMRPSNQFFNLPETKDKLQQIANYIFDQKNPNFNQYDSEGNLLPLEQAQEDDKNEQIKKSIQTLNKYIQELNTQSIDTQSVMTGKNPRNPERGINRYQMMEILTRIAEEKYINKYQKTKNYHEAVELLWNEHLKNEMTSPKYDPMLWRENRYYNEDFEHVYKRFSKKKVKPGQQPFMCLEELQQIAQMAGLLELPWFGANSILFAFNYSMMTQIDELGSDRKFQMNQLEFYEAIARIADDACLVPLPGVYENEPQLADQKMKMPLAYKLEGLLMAFLENCCELQFKLNYPKPQKSIFWVDPDESDFELID